MFQYHAGTIKNAREAIQRVAQEEGLASYPVAIALDTKGPEIRTGLLEGVSINTKHSTLKLFFTVLLSA